MWGTVRKLPSAAKAGEVLRLCGTAKAVPFPPANAQKGPRFVGAAEPTSAKSAQMWGTVKKLPSAAKAGEVLRLCGTAKAVPFPRLFNSKQN
jgi:hypothetical protein